MNVYIKKPEQQADACVIWMHGLGADASDMASLAEQLIVDSVALRHVFLDAPIRPVTLNNGLSMRAWYDISGMKLTDREDREGILQSEEFIRQVIDSQIEEGFTTEQIFLAGFSQGGAMALYTALHMTSPLAGVIALSAYLPLADQCKTNLPKETPIFVAGGQYDPIVLPMWTKQSAEWLTAAGYSVSTHNYLMEHSVCAEELNDLSSWLSVQAKGAN
ncbi:MULTISPECIES: alpha/beta hydrolase [Legionella]|uniref:Phospholipase/carboxylesterase n=1 Tax=Legionella drozanskii LLAP-1 TaxID=1212489 RepID=A0A0W0T851_9GAMM|nr:MULTISPECIES: alpha/beta hydrolase-fold protein [Legionella]KTC91796.1 phospholipase/carboxylesterase [Legionella drozanskii LLAP-1]PJE17989.1 MAG: carboxylesterase [Legionella sp.]